MLRTMGFILKQALLFFLLYVVFSACILAESDSDNSVRLRSAPHKNVRSSVIDGSGKENADDFDGTSGGLEERKGGYNRVSISTVALFTLAMAAATGLGAVPFFFVELDPHWEGLCGGMAAGVMLAASFDLIQEGQSHGAGSWVVIGILSGGIFILLCKKFRRCFRLLCFVAFWSRAIAWWLHSCCICSCIPSSACPSHGCSIWHCVCPCCMATYAATRVFKDGVFPPRIFACTGSSICPCFKLQHFQNCRSQKGSSDQFTNSNGLSSECSRPSVFLIMWSGCLSCVG